MKIFAETAPPFRPETPGLILTLVILSVFAMAAVKCLSMLRRETTSKLCLLGLASYFTAYAFSFLGHLSNLLLDGPARTLLTVIMGMFVALLYLAAPILAIIGLATYSSPRTTPHTQGKAQAIWTLVLAIIPLFLVIGMGVMRADKAGLSGPGASPAEPTPIVNKELNFRFDPPPRPWVALNAKVHNPDAAMMYRRARPESIFMVIVEPVGVEAEVTNETITDFARANLEGNEGDFVFEDLPDRVVNGINFSVFRSRTDNFKGQTGVMRWEHWVSFHHGYGYQLVFFANSDNKESLSKSAEELANRFAPADPDHVLTLSGPKVAPYQSPENGVAADFSDSWSDYTDRETDYPESCFAAMSENQSTGVSVVKLGGLDPGIDELASGLVASTFSFTHPEKTEARAEITQGIASGIEIHAKREVDGVPHHYRFRILRHQDHVWLLAVWGQEKYRESFAATLDRYQISEPVAGTVAAETSKIHGVEEAQALNQTGLAYYRRENHRAARPFFEEAYRRDPASPGYFDNFVDSLYRSGDYERVLETVRSHEELAKTRPVLKAYEGSSLRSLERDTEAAEAYERAFSAGYDDEDDLLDFINILVDTKQQERGLEVLSRFQKDHPDSTVSVERWQATLLSQLDRHDEAIALLEQLLGKNPSSLRIASDLVDKRIDAEHYAEALVEVEALLAGGSRNAELLFLKGRAKLGLESYREARTAFEEARTLAPEDREIAEYIEHASTLLGKGDIALIRETLEPLPLPSEIAALAEQLQQKHGEGLTREYGATQLQRIVGVSYQPGKPQKTTSKTVVHITGPAGLEDFSTLRFSFDPSSEKMFVNEVIVTNEDGEQMGVGNVEDYFLVDENDDELATTEKVVHVPVPGIAVGSTLTYTVTTEHHRPSEKLRYDSLPMSSHYPSVGRILYFESDPARIAIHKSEGIQTSPFDGGIAYFTDGPPMWHNENMQIWVEDFLPWITYADAALEWKVEAADYLKRLAPVLEGEDEIVKAKAVEITALSTTTAEKISALSDYVAGTLTYQGIEFGPRGRMPETCSTILRNRYGDCKDHSLLLVRLLRAVGIEAHLALVSVGAPVRESLPSLDQFDHMIAYVPAAEGSPFLDTTADRFPHGELAPYHLLNEKALILAPDNARLETVVPGKTSGHRYDSRREIRLDPTVDGAIVVEETLIIDGYMAAWLRVDFDGWRPPEYSREIAGLLRDYGSPDIRSFEVEGLDTARGPLKLNLTYSLPSRVKLRDGRVSLSPPAVWERYFLERRDTSTRRNPFEISIPTEFTSQASLIFPDRTPDPLSLDEIAATHSDDFCDWKISASSPSPGQVDLISSAAFKPGQFSKDRFQDFVRSSNLGIEAWSKSVVWDPAP